MKILVFSGKVIIADFIIVPEIGDAYDELLDRDVHQKKRVD